MQTPAGLSKESPTTFAGTITNRSPHGTTISKRNIDKAKYDSSYRITANFLDYVSGKYDKSIVSQMNTAMRQGKYSDDLWKQYTGKTAPELGDEWKSGLEKSLGMAPSVTTKSNG